MAEKDLKALFVHQLKDTYFAENAILKALPQMAEAAQSEELKGALAIHLRETEGQVKRLEQVFRRFLDPPAHSVRRVFPSTAGRLACQAGPSPNVRGLSLLPAYAC